MGDVELDPTQPAAREDADQTEREWHVEGMPGFRITSPYVAHDPNCPSGPHPTRDCRCRVFRTRSAAWSYISQVAKMENEK